MHIEHNNNNNNNNIVTVDSDFSAHFALEILNIISTCSHMAVGGFFRRFFRIFCAPPACPKLSARFLSWSRSRRLQLFLSWSTSRRIQLFRSWNTLRQHLQFTLPLHLSWKILRQQLSPLQLQLWSSSRQFRLQRQLCHRHLQQVFNLVKVRIEFPRKFPP